MAISFFHVYNGMQLVPQNTVTPSVAGDIRFNSSNNQMDVFTTAVEQIVTTNATQTLTNKTFSGSSTSLTVKDSNFTIQNATDPTEILKFDASAITTGTTATFSTPHASDLLVGAVAVQTISNKTLTTPTIAQIQNGVGSITFNTTGSIAVPSISGSDTLSTLNAIQTFTNKLFGDAITLTQITTPTNPASGSNKVYSKSDNNLYILTSAGVESKVGAGSVTSVGLSVPTFLSVTPSTITSSGTFVVTLSGTALPIANGGTGVTTPTTSPTASAFVGWDTNKNLSANALIEANQTIATAAGTTTLTVSSPRLTQFTGTTTQTLVLPNATTLAVGQSFTITNRSTGIVTVNNSTPALLQQMNPGSNGSQAIFTLINNSTTAGVWDIQYSNSGLVVGIQPTIQKFTGSSGTYTLPTGAQYIRVRMVGGGGGGAGSGTTAGSLATVGGNTAFGTSLLTANGGGAGVWGNAAAAGGTASLGTGPIGTAIQGANGGGSGAQATGSTVAGSGGGQGASSPFGGAGAGGFVTLPGISAVPSTGSGGGGAGTGNAGTNNFSGSGGSAGGFVDAIITSPLSTYAYAVGSAGAAGGAGTSGQVGGVGSGGYIEVTEYYSNVAIGTIAVVAAIQPQITNLTSGSGTYTVPTGTQYLRVRAVGGGGGGSGGGTASGTLAGTGGASTFGTSMVAANGGTPGLFNTAGAVGGTASLGTGPIGTAVSGGYGAPGNGGSLTQTQAGAQGGSSYFGGAGGGAQSGVGGGLAGASNSGGGGGGGSNNGALNSIAGNGGGAGGFVDAIITSPTSTYSYSVGAAGTAGGAGTSGGAGGAGGSGYIEVTAYFSNFSVGTTTSVAANTVLAGPQSGVSAGPTFRTLVSTDLPVINSAIKYEGGNGFGSTNTVIRRFSTNVYTVGTDITYTGSATLGDIFTINTTGMYSVTVADASTAAAGFGMSVNSAQLTTDIASITNTARLGLCVMSGTNDVPNSSVTKRFTAGDIIRHHGSGAANGADVKTNITICRIT